MYTILGVYQIDYTHRKQPSAAWTEELDKCNMLQTTLYTISMIVVIVYAYVILYAFMYTINMFV